MLASLAGLMVGGLASVVYARAMLRRAEGRWQEQARATTTTLLGQLRRSQEQLAGSRNEAERLAGDLRHVGLQRDQYARTCAALEAKMEAAREKQAEQADALRTCRADVHALNERVRELSDKNAHLQAQRTEERRATDDLLSLIDETEKQLADVFDALSRRTLDAAADSGALKPMAPVDVVPRALQAPEFRTRVNTGNGPTGTQTHD